MREAHWSTVESDACRDLWKALRPNILVRVFIPDRDCSGSRLPPLDLITWVQREFTRLAGGQTSFAGSGDYAPGTGEGWQERTTAVETYLPAQLSDASRDDFVDIVVQVGRRARQREVLVAVGIAAYRIPIFQTSQQEQSNVAPRAAVA